MKTTIILYLTLILSSPLWANIGHITTDSGGFNYQAVARNTDGEILSSENIQLRFGLYPGAYTTTPDWQETHMTTTDAYGVFSLTIGKGIKTESTVETFDDLNFVAFEYWLKIEINDNGQWAEVHFEALKKVPYAASADASSDGTRPGMIVPFAGPAENIPEGWLLCDGSQLDRVEYEHLFSAIGTAWGSGDGASTFHLPDLRGLFLRAVDSGRNQDADRSNRLAMKAGGNTGDAVGSYQNDELERHRHNGRTDSAGEHSHYFYGHIGSGEAMLDAGRETGDRSIERNRYKTSTDGNHTHSFTTNYAGGSETRPKNAYVNYIIKL